MRAASEISTSSVKKKIEKLCLDDHCDVERFEEIANNPLCEIENKQFFSTHKGMVWVVVEFTEAMP